MKKLMNDHGFGLIPMLMALAVGGIVIGGLATGITLMINSQKSVEVSRASKSIEDELEVITSTTAGCTNLLRNQIAPQTAGTKVNVTSTLPLATGAVNVGANQPLAPGLVTDGFWIEGTGEQEIGGLTPGQTRRIVTLNLQVKKDIAGLFPPLSRPRTVRVHASVNGAGQIQACIAETPEVLACGTSGRVFDPAATSIGTQCQLYNYCDWGGSYVDPAVPTNSGGFNNQFTGGRSCPSGYIPQTTGVISSAVTCGKNCVTNNTYPVYTCMKCGGGMQVGNLSSVPANVPIGDANDQISEFDQTQDIYAVQTYCLENNIPQDYCPWGTTTYPVWPSPTPAAQGTPPNL